MTSAPSRRAHVVGLGLIGASLALALGERGWSVTGDDVDADVLALALGEGIVEGTQLSEQHEIVFVATPAGW